MSTPLLITPEQVAKLQELATKATSGEWVAYFDEPHGTGHGIVHRVGLRDEEEYIAEMGHATSNGVGSRLEARQNADYIAACDPQTILALLADRASLIQRGAAMEAELNDIRVTIGNPSALHTQRSLVEKVSYMMRMLVALNAPATIPGEADHA